MLIFGAVFWNSATEDYYNPLNEVTYEINSCLQYMDPPLSSMEERDDCIQKRQLGGIFTVFGVIILWATVTTGEIDFFAWSHFICKIIEHSHKTF